MTTPRQEDLVTLLATNPVFCLDRIAVDAQASSLRTTSSLGCLDALLTSLRNEGHCLPPAALERWYDAGLISQRIDEPNAPPHEPRVVGLTHDRFSGTGFVVPLVAETSAEWSIDDTLPSRLLEVTRLLQQVCVAAIAGDRTSIHKQSFPEAHAISMHSPFPIPCDGTSMDLALLLCCLDCLGERRTPLLRAACAVATVEGGAVVGVGGVTAKLRAFTREIGRGTLLVRTVDDEEAAAFDPWFETVWRVASVQQLADQLAAAGLLGAFSDPTAMDMAAGERMLARLRILAESRQAHREVIDLSKRLLRANWHPTVPRRMRLAARAYLPASLRHLGMHGEALEHARDWASQVETDPRSSHEDRACAALEHAASLFDPWRVEEALAVLQPWLDRLDKDPRLLSAQTRVRIWNTAGRALSLLGRDDWANWFQRSLDLQQHESPSEVARTRNYYVLACLRANQLDQAASLIADATEELDAWSGHCRAELARRQQRIWTHDQLEARQPVRGQANHALGFYLQATARQLPPGQDAAHRFERAAKCFRMDAEGTEAGNVLWVLCHTMEFATANIARDQVRASRALSALGDAITQPGLEVFHAQVADLLPRSPESQFEPLLQSLPWL